MKNKWEKFESTKFVIQYQALQIENWYDDPFFKKSETKRRAECLLDEHGKDNVRYRIVERKVIQRICI